MSDTLLDTELTHAEGLIIEHQFDEAYDLLQHLAEDIEEYASKNYVATDDEQWFSFPGSFERLAYARVEDDPREIHVIDEPYDEVYDLLALTSVQLDNREGAIAALREAVRWNPMDCAYRLNLADLYFDAGNLDEYLGLTYSVFERASRVEHLARAYANFADYFAHTGDAVHAAACLLAGKQLDCQEPYLMSLLESATGSDWDPAAIDTADAQNKLEGVGIPFGANAEIAACLLICATDVAGTGKTQEEAAPNDDVDATEDQARKEATAYMLRARDLIGDDACKALIELLVQTDSELAREKEAGE